MVMAKAKAGKICKLQGLLLMFGDEHEASKGWSELISFLHNSILEIPLAFLNPAPGAALQDLHTQHIMY
ncbi:uncharacterized protein ARMOST_11485 [Armillaria ostoyae]|uniref:Uncharacterized protein n=1 Tax=Armillaria ostoyae TaxID=47428 RepID=A0A284RHA4_ARMOS|nr:uncharacterized protein ARMOST_11485 [Armillaria ostoyae]